MLPHWKPFDAGGFEDAVRIADDDHVASLDQLRQWFPLQRALFGTGAPFYYWQGSRLGLAGARMHDEARSGILGRNALEVFAWD